MKKLALLLCLIALPAHAAKFQHIEAMPTGWQFLYYSGHQPIVVFVPKCTGKIADKCGWNHTSSKAIADKEAAMQEKAMRVRK